MQNGVVLFLKQYHRRKIRKAYLVHLLTADAKSKASLIHVSTADPPLHIIPLSPSNGEFP